MIRNATAFDVLMQASLTTVSDSQLCVVPAGQSWRVVMLAVANYTGSAATFTLNLVDVNGSPGAVNYLFGAKRVAANDTFLLESVWYVPPSWKLTGHSGTASAMSIALWGERIKVA